MKSSIKLALAVTAITLGFISAFPTVSAARPVLTGSECNLLGGKWLPLAFLDYDTDARLYGFTAHSPCRTVIHKHVTTTLQKGAHYEP
jgi:hypothetical protein